MEGAAIFLDRPGTVERIFDNTPSPWFGKVVREWFGERRDIAVITVVEGMSVSGIVHGACSVSLGIGRLSIRLQSGLTFSGFGSRGSTGVAGLPLASNFRAVCVVLRLG